MLILENLYKSVFNPEADKVSTIEASVFFLVKKDI